MPLKLLKHQTSYRTNLSRTLLATIVWSLLLSGLAHAQYLPAEREMIPTLEQVVVPYSTAHPRNDHSMIIPLSDDRLMMAWTEYYSTGTSDFSPSQIMSKISTDAGRTWSTPSLLQENLWENVKYPNFVRLPSDDILFFFRGWDSTSEAAVYMKRSSDEGATWSDMVQISEPGPGVYWNNADRVITLSSGRIILPTFTVADGAPYTGADLESFVYYSDDGFQTWHKSEMMTAPGRGAHEPSVVELSDGRLLCFLRTNLGTIYQAFSEDSGATWSTPESTGLSAPGSPSQLKRIPQTGDLLAIWNNVQYPDGNLPRTPLTAAISKDDGATWINYQDIFVSPEIASYSSVFFQDDEAIVMASTGLEHDSIVAKYYSIDEFYVPEQPQPSSGLSTVGYWRFEGRSGVTVADGTLTPSVGTPILDEVGGNHAVATSYGDITWQGVGSGELFGAVVPNPDPVDTTANGTLNANGINTRSQFFGPGEAHLRIADSNTLDFSDAFTLEGYFCTDTDDINILINKRSSTDVDHIGYKVFMDADGALHFGVDNGPTWGRVGFDDAPLNDGQWHHFAAVREQNGCLHIWVDGVEDLTPATNGVITVSGNIGNGEDLLIGHSGLGGVSDQSWDGYLDEIRLSNIALTPDQFLSYVTVPTIPGDANGDSKVDGSDVTILAGNWQVGVDGTVEATWDMGDFNGDKKVDGSDVTILAGNWQAGVTTVAAAVPESSTLVLILTTLATIAIVYLRKN